MIIHLPSNMQVSGSFGGAYIDHIFFAVVCGVC